MSHVMVWRGSLPEDGLSGFYHHGILCSDGTVIHYAGMSGVKSLADARILRTPFSAFDPTPSPERPVHTVVYEPALHATLYSHEEIESRAMTRLDHAQYHLITDNCESFARWCVTGREVSQQSTGAVLGLAAGLASIALGGGGVLGAVLTACVVSKVWDRRGNRSAIRAPPPDDDGHSDRIRERGQNQSGAGGTSPNHHSSSSR
jgi:HRAS-like suppressor 3